MSSYKMKQEQRLHKKFRFEFEIVGVKKRNGPEILLTAIRAKIVTMVMIVRTKRPFTILLIVFLMRAFGLDSIPLGFLALLSLLQHLVRQRRKKPYFTSTCCSMGKKSDFRSECSIFSAV